MFASLVPFHGQSVKMDCHQSTITIWSFELAKIHWLGFYGAGGGGNSNFPLKVIIMEQMRMTCQLWFMLSSLLSLSLKSVDTPSHSQLQQQYYLTIVTADKFVVVVVFEMRFDGGGGKLIEYDTVWSCSADDLLVSKWSKGTQRHKCHCRLIGPVTPLPDRRHYTTQENTLGHLSVAILTQIRSVWNTSMWRRDKCFRSSISETTGTPDKHTHRMCRQF